MFYKCFLHFFVSFFFLVSGSKLNAPERWFNLSASLLFFSCLNVSRRLMYLFFHFTDDQTICVLFSLQISHRLLIPYLLTPQSWSTVSQTAAPWFHCVTLCAAHAVSFFFFLSFVFTQVRTFLYMSNTIFYYYILISVFFFQCLSHHSIWRWISISNVGGMF